MSEQLTEYLRAGRFIDSDHPAVAAFARGATERVDGELDRALALYAAVRDAIRYDPYIDYGDPACFRASSVLAAGRGFCVGKATLLAASCRAAGIPARVGFADVRNHMTSPRLQALVKTDVFIWHAYADLYLDGVWVKSTPAFDAGLCGRIGIPPLAFDGRTDSLFQPCDPDGRQRMEYLNYRGAFADVPFDRIVSDFHARYPSLMAASEMGGDFRREAIAPAQV
jgi:transglutaminase-like putative cysteine protease